MAINYNLRPKDLTPYVSTATQAAGYDASAPTTDSLASQLNKNYWLNEQVEGDTDRGGPAPEATPHDPDYGVDFWGEDAPAEYAAKAKDAKSSGKWGEVVGTGIGILGAGILGTLSGKAYKTAQNAKAKAIEARAMESAHSQDPNSPIGKARDQMNRSFVGREQQDYNTYDMDWNSDGQYSDPSPEGAPSSPGDPQGMNDAGVSGVDTGDAAKGGLITRYATGGFVTPNSTQGVGYADGGELPQGGPGSIGGAMEAGAPQPGPVGPVQGPGGPTEDAIPAELPEGSFVLNAEAVKITGQKKLNGLVNEAMEAMGPEAFMDPNAAPGPMGEAPQPLPVNISNGEWVLSPPLVDYFGLEFWEKMNDKGLPEGEKSTDKAKSGFKAEGVKAKEKPAEEEAMGFDKGGRVKSGLWGESSFVDQHLPVEVRDRESGDKDRSATVDLMNNNIGLDIAANHNTITIGKVMNSVREVLGDDATSAVIRHAEKASDIVGEREGFKKGGFLGEMFGDDKKSKLKSDGEKYDPKLKESIKKERRDNAFEKFRKENGLDDKLLKELLNEKD
jgi:hypothetical protein